MKNKNRDRVLPCTELFCVTKTKQKYVSGVLLDSTVKKPKGGH